MLELGIIETCMLSCTKLLLVLLLWQHTLLNGAHLWVDIGHIWLKIIKACLMIHDHRICLWHPLIIHVPIVA